MHGICCWRPTQQGRLRKRHGALMGRCYAEIQADAKFDWELEFSRQAVSEGAWSGCEVQASAKFDWELEFSRQDVSEGLPRGDQFLPCKGRAELLHHGGPLCPRSTGPARRACGPSGPTPALPVPRAGHERH